ncbi:MAG: MotA/TolQ/ExbB proton channel family protein [Kiritimatiellae bacterium]|nr:MotA/TolQ/ExbB proton channel family protein [Kiritimatiellia bacterium]
MTFAGGPIFWILAVLAAAALFIFIERLLELRSAQVDWSDFLKGVMNVLESGNEAEALAICEDTPVPVASIAAAAIRHRKGSALALREAVDACGRSEMGRLERRIALLAIIGETAPLLGLLGTIFGFIKTVMMVNQDIVSRADLMGTAISALVLAAVGLAVAITAGVMYAALRLKLDRLVSDLEGAATEIVGYILSKEARA